MLQAVTTARLCGLSRFVSGLLLLGMLTGACFLPLEVKAAEDVKLLKEQKTERFIPLKLQEADLSMVEELDFDEIEQSVDEILGGEFQFENTVMEL